MANQPAVKKPSRPTIDTVTGNVGPHAGAIDPAGLTNDPCPVLSGHGDVGAIIHVRVDGEEVGTAEVGPDGTWTYQLAQPLPEGQCSLSVRASNSAGQSVPSKAYKIEVDVTPPSSPVIDHVSLDSPATLSGHAEPHSTVDVYDGKTLLGTVTAGADGQWTFPLPDDMADGKHVLTATASDLAGNASEASSSFNYVVGQPIAHAVVDQAGRDNGEHQNDFLTNDGTAGRLISGHIEGALGADNRVQVSTDGGRTWQDALMKANGEWVAIDPNAHTGNWTIQTRVVNAAGEQGEEDSTSVTLRAATTMPTDVSFDSDAGKMTVKFSPEQLAPGSKLSLMIDGHLSEHVLSASELASGVATFDAPVTDAKQVVAAVVDAAGNISPYHGVERVTTENSVSENFDSVNSVFFYKASDSVSTRYFDVTRLDSADSAWFEGLQEDINLIGTGGSLADAPTSRVLVITGRMRLDLHDGVSATRMSFDLGDMTTQEVVKLYFYDKNGNLIFTSPEYTADGGLHQKIDIDVGQEFARVEINQEWQSYYNTASWVDNIVFTGPGSTDERPVTIDPAAEQALIGDAAHYGSSGGTVFTVADVGYFSGAGAGAHGGAGVDTLKLTGANQVLDVTALNSGATDKLSGIEVIDLTGSGDNTLRMSMADVLNLGHPDAFRQDGYSQMRVTGDAGDRVELAGIPDLAAGGWANAGTFVIGGEQYVVYRNDALKAELFVREGVEVSSGSSIVPVIDAVEQSGSPSVSGHAAAHAQVTVYSGDTAIGTATAGADGTWTLTLPSGMQPGAHTLTASVTDAGGLALKSADFMFDVAGETAPAPGDPEVPSAPEVPEVPGNPGGQKQDKPPSRPTIDTVTDNVEPHTGPIGQAGLTNDPRPVLSGHGEAGSIIHVRVDNNEVGTVRVGSNGIWTYQLPEPLPDGLARLSVRASNSAGQSMPSKAYIIEVDVTPPPPPTIDHASSGTPATLSGHAEPYSTIDVYDGKTFLGTVTTGADSQWTLSLPEGMSVGNHTLTATSRDPAGNVSQSSANFDFVVEPEVPTAHAVVDDAGRDSGISHGDWLTNDGTAGRLIGGHIEGVLGAHDRVQISTDGGRTWQDALMKSNGKWVAVDPNAHTGNWTIQTRVVNDAGKQGEQDSTAVTLKDSTAMPFDVSVNHDYGSVTVRFSPEQVAADWKLSLMIDGRLYEHVLSQQEVASGMASFYAPVTGAKQVVAAMVDTAGNISAYRGTEHFKSEGTISENFESLSSDSYLYRQGATASTRYFDVTCLDVLSGVWRQGLLTGRDVAGWDGAVITEVPTSRVLAITGRVRLDLKDGMSATRMSFDLGDMTTQEVVKLYFYDKNGNLIFTSREYTAAGGVHQYVDIDVGREFARVEINNEWRSADDGMNWVDNIVFTGSFGTSDRPVTRDPLTWQALTGDMAYYGGSQDTVFNVSDVGYFSGANAGAHGGVGNDTLRLTGANQVLDITALNSGATDKISGIEVIDITGSGDNTLRMSMADVLNLGHPDAFRQDGYSQMRVTGNAGDRVELAGIPDLAAGGWASAGNFVIGGEQYVVYRNDALKAELFVRDGVALSSGSSVVPAIDSVVLNGSPSVSGHAAAQAQVTVYDGDTSIGTATARADGTWTLALPSGMQPGAHALTASVTDAGGLALKSAEFPFDFGGTISHPAPSSRSLAGLFDGMNHDASDSTHADHGAGDATPKLSLADVLSTSHQELFRTDGGTQVRGTPELAAASNEGRPVPDGAGHTGAHNAAQDVDLMMQAAMQTTLMP
ncbi:Ig-like domain-containing protein [Burkholderia sp. 22PA0099]|uniref:Ig-like domain-containing protein n=1 Tax=Burkholderia sp. 22PA0099 TaxID=3237372 RepID=UPI0039C452E2